MKNIYRNDWINIYTGFEKTSFRISPASYFSDRAHMNFTPSLLIPLIGIFFTGFSFLSLIWIPFLALGYGSVYLDFPIHSGINNSEYPEYGYYWYGEGKWKLNSFWWCWKRKKHCFYMPWSWDWVRTSVLRKDNTWEHETKGNYKDFYHDEWKNVIWKESYPYTYVLKNGEIQHRMAELKVEEREWRWKWLKWSVFPNKKRKTISIEFSYAGPLDRFVILEKRNCKTLNSDKVTGEVGERTGSWKGGTIGCGYDILPGETPLQSLRRMEKERKF